MSLAFVHAHDGAEPHTDAVWGVSWTNADTVLSISADGAIKQWDSISGQVSHSRPPHTLGLVSLSVDPTGKLALYNTLEGLTCLWSLEDGDLKGSYESFARTAGSESNDPSWSVSLNPKGGTYASTGGSGNVTIHSAETPTFGERRATLKSGRSKFGMFCKHSPDGSRVAMSSENGIIYVFDIVSASIQSMYSSHAMAVRSLAWSPDSSLLLSASEDKRLILHDLRTSSSGKPGSGAVAAFSGHSSWVLSTDISPDGRLALSGSSDKTVKVWDIGARAAVSTVQDQGEVWSVSWRPRPPAHGTAGAYVTGGEEGVVRWWRSAGAG
ncbi:WD repeat-containing protein 61 [Epithele typhae]|uniref:WD repeat-containing protein 61 n=1 Tax=Epithele typhae TaxID=378194 RepID=UPI00200821EA|nr:WD repeat-containing protein 61 [Epithele typhae]KAH9943254.1 WD repeat-containing protein 61 [Epithele typhae]